MPVRTPLTPGEQRWVVSPRWPPSPHRSRTLPSVTRKEATLSGPHDLALPRGFRDILPTEARELHLIRDALLGAFGSYGYVPLEPPTVEFARAAAAVDERRLMRFLDQGDLLALRPDVTSAIARVVATRYRDAAGALRLSYFTSVFRQERSMRGSEREYDQAGVELIGAAGALADAEVLALLHDALAAVGLREAIIEVGHLGAVRALFDGLPPDTLEQILAHLRGADHVEAFRVAAAAGLSAERVDRARRALAGRGKAIEAVDVPGATELREAIHLARELSPGTWGVPDLSVIPALPYYTGLVFEVVSARVGFPLAAGGRYDGLLDQGRPATGFGIAIPHLHQALVAEGWTPPAIAPLLTLEGGDHRTRLRIAAALRKDGLHVALGAVADTAGRTNVVIRVRDERTIELDGRSIAVNELASALSERHPKK